MRAALAAFQPPTRRHPPPPPSAAKDRGQGVIEIFAHHPDLARAFFTFNGHVLWGTTLTARQRQTIVLRVAARREAAFLWAEHRYGAHDAGLTDEEIARIAFGPDAPHLDPLERALIQAVDELIDDGVVGAATWAELASTFDAQQLLDVVFTAGCYETVAWFMRSVELPVHSTPTEGDDER
jgi:alkylhydroperoxidase family enzyme